MSWTVEEEKLTIKLNGEVVAEFEGEITAENVRKTARDNGIKNLKVVLEASDEEVEKEEANEVFPVKENVVISQVNKAGL